MWIYSCQWRPQQKLNSQINIFGRKCDRFSRSLEPWLSTKDIKNVGNQTVGFHSIVKYTISQWLPSTVWLQAFFIISFVLHRIKTYRFGTAYGWVNEALFFGGGGVNYTIKVSTRSCKVHMAHKAFTCLDIQVHVNKLECRGKVHLFQ